MRHWMLLPLILSMGGCAGLLDLFRPSTVTLTFDNAADASVKVTVFIHDDQNVLQALIDEVGEEIEMIIPSGAVRSITKDCDDAQAVFLDEAELMLLGDIGPEEDADILRDGDDYGCGDEIVFRFTHANLLDDFKVAVSVQ